MIRLTLAAIIGGVLTFAWLLPSGLLVAALAAPFGGCAAALVAVVWTTARGSGEARMLPWREGAR